MDPGTRESHKALGKINSDGRGIKERGTRKQVKERGGKRKEPAEKWGADTNESLRVVLLGQCVVPGCSRSHSAVGRDLLRQSGLWRWRKRPTAWHQARLRAPIAF